LIFDFFKGRRRRSNDRHIRGYTTEENQDIAPLAVFLVRCVLSCAALYLPPKAELSGWA
jgi:hypothetical protein